MKKNYPFLVAGAIWALLPGGAAAQAPYASGFVPARNDFDASPVGSVNVTFSQPVTGASGIRVFGSRRGGLLSGNGSGDGTTQLHFQVSQGLGLGEMVSVTVPSTVRGTNGLPVPGTVYQFRTPVSGSQFINAYPGTGSLPEVGTALYDPTLADVNNDGKIDLLLADAQNDRVRLRLGNNGPGFFDAATLLSTGEQPGSIAVADMNNDGQLDLLTSSNGATVRMVSVALGNGMGGFGVPAAVPVAAPPGRVRVGDVNADGNLDFVVPLLVPATPGGAPASTVLAVRLGNGQGAFAAAPDVPLDPSASSPNLHLADFNNDGQLDCLVGSTSTNLLKTYLGNGQGGFALAGTTPLARTGATDAADVTGDGLLDVVMADGPGNAVRLYPGTGQGGFGTPTVFTLASPTGVLATSIPGGVGIFATYNSAAAGAGTALWGRSSNVTGTGAFNPRASLMSNCAGTSLVMGSVYTSFPLLVIVDNGTNGAGPNVKARLDQVVTASRPSAKTLPAACFPNPAHQSVQVVLPTGAAGLRAEVYNGLGQCVRRQELGAVAVGSAATLNVSALPAGLYTLRLAAGPQSSTQALAIE
ncbi:T9SS type A sorting domain-containing protein [Hymenobacter ruricola]|uniref:T9SS type A sorting domain-containing protein n=1 Tax=Hymenobacter ruricola TaxID=2791023 RepID=A0ABS0I0S0_9BACT|nr:T9SS type A sorting domain-containing protein [Hymenobacter ruricola]MBF9220535.1 T9SS type A sorting domain-containing protein [Hymenobacter ruricola]